MDQSIPLPGMGNDPVGNSTTPLQSLASILSRQPQATTPGSISAGPQIMQPTQIGQGGNRPVPPIGPAQGEFQTKGAHSRASMAALSNSVQGVVAKAQNAHDQTQNKILGQKFQSLVGSQKGIQAAQEMQQNAQKVLAQDPNNADAKAMMTQAQDMLQHNTTILNQMLDPTTPEGKKNIKLFSKGFGFDDKNADTPERAAAIEAMKKQQPGLSSGAAGLMSQMPQGIGMSPQTQVNAEMVKAGVTPKAATGGQVLASETKLATTGATIDAKKAAQEERLGLDDKGQPKPLDQLPLKVQAQVNEERTKDQLASAQAQLAKAKAEAMSNPNSLQNQIALKKAQGYAGIAQAMMLRAHVGLLNYKMNAYGEGENNDKLPGSIEINGQTMGKAMAGAAVKAIQTQAQFIDASGAVDNLDAAAQEMQAAGQRLNDPKLVKLLNDPRMKAGDNEWFHNQMNSEIGSSLTSQQRDYLIASRQARENIMAIRKVIGTGVSVKAMDAITSTLPGAQTPDYDYAKRQIQAVKGQLQRLQQGVPQVNIPNRPNQPGAGATPAGKAGDPLGIF